MQRRYALCGVSHRSLATYLPAMVERFPQHCQVVGLLDPDPLRFIQFQKRFPSITPATYAPSEFAQLCLEQKPDVVVVTAIDSAHTPYILGALQRNLDVLVEKPMVTTMADCAEVLAAERHSQGRITVAFNLRYTKLHRIIKEQIHAGAIGRVTHVELSWSLDGHHGASYFRRWHRRRDHSGGLAVHKCGHHFDLVAFWLDDEPEDVFAYGALHHYGPGSEWDPGEGRGRYCGECRVIDRCAFHQHWQGTSHIDASLSSGHRSLTYSTFRPDACVFDAEIDIEDTYVAALRYRRGALLSYTVDFAAPFEGYRVVLAGTQGRLEATRLLAPERAGLPHAPPRLIHYPRFGKSQIFEVVEDPGPHQGGDHAFLADLLGGQPQGGSPRAGSRAGALALATAEAMAISMKERRAVALSEVLSIADPKEQIHELR